MNRDTELKKGFLEVMQNKILKDKRQVIRYWDFIPVCIKEQKVCNSKVGCVHICSMGRGGDRQKALYMVRM